MGHEPRQRELIAAVAASPEQDAPILVYADWLDEHGDSARAEFIRAQIERDHISPFDVRSLHLSLREEALHAEHGARWLAEIPTPRGCERVDFCRGAGLEVLFDERLVLLQTFAEAVREGAPVIRASSDFLAEEKDPQNQAPIESLRALRVHGVEDMSTFVELPLLSTLSELSLDGCYFDMREAEYLLSSPHMKRLETLHIEVSDGNAFIRELVANPSLLRNIRIPAAIGHNQNCFVDPMDREGIEMLCSWDGLGRIEKIDLSGHTLGAAGLSMLLASPLAASLRGLYIQNIGDEPELLAAFMDAHPDLKLQELRIGGLSLSQAGAEALSAAPCLEGLECLGVYALQSTEGAWDRLSQAPWFEQIRAIHAEGSPVSSLMRALCERMPPALHTLSLQRCFGRLSPEDSFAELLRSSSADTLLSLSFDTSLKPSPVWSALSEGSLRDLLRLSWMAREDEATLKFLLNKPIGQRLRSLQLNGHSFKPKLSAR